MQLAGLVLALAAKAGHAQMADLPPCRDEQERGPCTVKQNGPFRHALLEPGMNVQVMDKRIVISWVGAAAQVTIGGITVDTPLPRVARDVHQVVIRYENAPKLKSIVYFYVTRPDGSKFTEYGEFFGPQADRTPAMPKTQGAKMDFGDAVPAAEVWLPPGYDASLRYPIVYVADSGDNRGALVADAIRRGELAPVIVVGVDACARAASGADCRRNNYMDGLDPPYGDRKRFHAYRKSFIDTVVAQVEARYGAPPDASQRAVAGYSNGADWAGSMAFRHPELFGRAIVMSPGGTVLAHVAPESRATVFALSGGELEPAFTNVARCFSGAVAAAGGTATLRLYPSGHSELMWADAFMAAMKDWLGVPRPPTVPAPARPAWCPALWEQ
jgi:enterochelin esterase-like enzyme